MTIRTTPTVLMMMVFGLSNTVSCTTTEAPAACPTGQILVAGLCQSFGRDAAATGGGAAGGTGGGAAGGTGGSAPGGGGSGGSVGGTMADAGGTPMGPTVALPFAIDAYYGPSGYMGDGAAGGIATGICPVRGGEMKGMCHQFTWTPGTVGWAGVFWQNPDGYWGMPVGMGLRIAPGARQITFWAWGAVGGEKVGFSTGYEVNDGFTRKMEATLTTTPTMYSIDLTGISYTQVGGGFAWTAAMSTRPVTFMVDDIQWR